jgi:hypothetical protein
LCLPSDINMGERELERIVETIVNILVD